MKVPVFITFISCAFSPIVILKIKPWIYFWWEIFYLSLEYIFLSWIFFTRIYIFVSDVAIGYSLYKVTSQDPDDNSILRHYIVEPKSAINPDGVQVNRQIYDYSVSQLNPSNFTFRSLNFNLLTFLKLQLKWLKSSFSLLGS